MRTPHKNPFCLANYLENRKTYGKKYIGHKMLVSFSTTIFVRNIFHPDKYFVSYTRDARSVKLVSIIVVWF
jgi:hypothetical protein